MIIALFDERRLWGHYPKFAPSKQAVYPDATHVFSPPVTDSPNFAHPKRSAVHRPSGCFFIPLATQRDDSYDAHHESDSSAMWEPAEIGLLYLADYRLFPHPTLISTASPDP